MHEEDRIYQFIKGLKPAIKTKVKIEDPKTLDEAISLADRVDSSIWEPRRKGTSHRRKKNTWRRVENVSEPMDIGAVESYKPKKFDKSNVECYRCHQKGHFKRECPLKGQHQ